MRGETGVSGSRQGMPDFRCGNDLKLLLEGGEGEGGGFNVSRMDKEK